MSRPEPLRLAFFVVLSILFGAFGVQANPSDDVDLNKPEVTARVARISLVSGDVRLRRADSQDTETAMVNVPLVEGDQLITGKDGRAEIQIDAYNFVRIAEDSTLNIVTLRDEGIALSLPVGNASVRLARFDKDKEYFEVDAPKSTVAAERKGLYRIGSQLMPEGTTEVVVTVRFGGQARIYSDTAGFTLKQDRSARLIVDGDTAGDWNMARAGGEDDWDQWVGQREYELAQRTRYDYRDKYYDQYIYGAEDLDSYGDWFYAGSYGYVWRPRASLLSGYSNWAPFRYGHWIYLRPYGWTWIADEPWGWAPYHYGRWVFYNGFWCWAPTGYASYFRSWWYPAQVVFVYVNNNYGQSVCWYPTPYHQPGHGNGHYNGPVKTPGPVGPGPTPVATNPPRGGAHTPALSGPKDPRTPPLSSSTAGTVPQGGPRGIKPPLAGSSETTDTVYQTAVSGVKVGDFGNVRIRNNTVAPPLVEAAIKAEPVLGPLPVKPTRGNSVASGDGSVRPVRSAPVPEKSQIATGAAPRTPGVALDNQLQNVKIYNGRTPATAPVRNAPQTGGGSVTNDVPVRTPNTGAVVRPTRPVREPVTSGSDTPPVRPTRNDTPVYSPPVRPDPPPVKYEPPPRPVQPPVRNDPPPVKYEPPPRYDPPPPRYDPPPRNDPPPRHDPPPRNDPPPKSDPPPAKSEPLPSGGKRGRD